MAVQGADLELARKILMGHSRSKLNGKFPDLTNFEAQLTNPLCGDHVQLKGFVLMTETGEIITDLGFSASACAICTASASLLCEQVRGLAPDAALAIGTLFEDSILEVPGSSWPEQLTGLRSFQHLQENPARRACALLPFVVLRKGLGGRLSPE